jgi:hypothetical protein
MAEMRIPLLRWLQPVAINQKSNTNNWNIPQLQSNNRSGTERQDRYTRRLVAQQKRISGYARAIRTNPWDQRKAKQ